MHSKHPVHFVIIASLVSLPVEIPLDAPSVRLVASRSAKVLIAVIVGAEDIPQSMDLRLVYSVELVHLTD